MSRTKSEKQNCDLDPVFYAMPGGWCYHARKSCPMLSCGQFRLHGYREITLEEVRRRNLHPCRCAYDENYGGSDK